MTAAKPFSRTLDPSSDQFPDWLRALASTHEITLEDFRWQLTRMRPDTVLSDGAVDIESDIKDAPQGAPVVVIRGSGTFAHVVHGWDQLCATEEPVEIIWAVRPPHSYPAREPVLSPGQHPDEDRSYQARIDDWVTHTFGPDITMDINERSFRFLEEALELVQAAGLTREQVTTAADYVFAREKGALSQEVGGVSNCLAALCTAHGIDQAHAEEAELKRIWPKSDKIRAKRVHKPAELRG